MQQFRVVSMFDGISCGQLALQRAGIPYSQYIAFEINKDSIAVTQHNFPNTVQCGDVRNFCWESIGHCDLLLAGSPCQDLSSANRNREGLEGEKSSLFWEFIKAKEILKPEFFLLENVQMPAKDFETISQAVGIYPVNINSEKVSAQLRNRFYWTNIGEKNFNLFGFPTCAIPQPKDRKIEFKDIIESGYVDRKKAKCLLKSEAELYKNKDLLLRRYFKIGFCNLVWEDPNDKYSCRYLTQTELERLQTLPDGYTEILDRKRAARVIADAWTVEVISHIFSFLKMGGVARSLVSQWFESLRHIWRKTKMTIKFEDGKIYVEKGSKKPYTTIYEAAEYNNGKLKTLYIDTYWFDGLVDPATQGRIYEGSGSLERAENFNIKNFKEIGKLGVDFAVYKNSNLLEIKPSYSDLQTALEKIINAKPSEFANWHKMAAYCQKVAKEVLGAE